MQHDAIAEGTLNLDKDGRRTSKLRLIEIGLALVLTLVALLFLVFAAWGQEMNAIAISEGWARPSLGKGTVTAAYMTMKNSGGSDDVLKAAKSTQAKRVEIHETKMSDDGVMKMRPVEGGLPIPAGGSVQLKPGGLHLMVMGLHDKVAEGDTLTLTLEFEKSGPMEVSFPVGKAPSAMDQH